MSFVSSEFFILFAGLLALLLVVRSHLWRLVLLLAVSCIFYAWSDWRFLGLLASVTVVDYAVARALTRSDSPAARKWLLFISVTVNLGFLFIFKYFNFFIDTLNRAGRRGGWHIDAIEIALPIGISFYTFETLSYVIDVYRRVTPPAKSLLHYAVFITFFPRLVAGPIMRAQQFLPQIERGLRLSPGNLVEGAQLFSRGLLKKLVIADNIAYFVDHVYRDPSQFAPVTVWSAAFAYSFQILCDFSGYTDMAMGIARVMGITLPPNFQLPYTAQSLTEFWQRWHISLSTWLRDYLYIPLGGNRHGVARTYLNLLLTMLLGGVWHGANWTFIFWGLLHGSYLALERVVTGGRRPQPAPWTSPVAWLRAAACFITVTLTWVFFRSPTRWILRLVVRKLLFLDRTGFVWLYWPALALSALVFLCGFLARRKPSTPPPFALSSPLTPAFLVFAALAAYLFSPTDSSPFIYFRF